MRSLTVDKKIGYGIALLLMAVSFLILLVPKDYLLWSAAGAFIVCAAAAYSLIKKRSIHSYNRNQVLLIISVTAVLYLTLYYLSGIEFGFVISQSGGLSLGSFVKNILPFVAIVVSTEIARSVLLAQNSRIVTVASYLFGVASEIACAGGIPALTTAYRLTDFLGLVIFPALAANILFTYLSKRYGVVSNISYRLILGVYVFLIPIVPNLPKIIPAFVLIVMPILLLIFINMLFEKKERVAAKKTNKVGIVFYGILGVIMAGVILLVTCQFQYGILVIATDSMTGEINKGDAVVFESYEYCGEIKENDVIVFTENDRQIVHRVVAINTINGQRQYITKGDANDGVDSGYRTDSQIIGVVRFKVLYIGYPSLWLKDAFMK